MKKKLFMISMIGLMIFGCDKNDTMQTAKTKSAAPNSNNSLEKDRIDPINCAINRCPTSWDRCAADCIYTSVCYCWDSYLYLGACECSTSGIARFTLKVRPLQSSPSSSGSSGKDVNARIVMNTIRFEELLNFMESLNIKTNKLRDIYNEIVKNSTSIEKGEKVIVQSEDYEKFLQVYDTFLGELEPNENKSILTYINKKSKEAGFY